MSRSIRKCWRSTHSHCFPGHSTGQVSLVPLLQLILFYYALSLPNCRPFSRELAVLVASLPFQDPVSITDVLKVLEAFKVFKEPAFLRTGLWSAIGATALYHSSESARNAAWARVDALRENHRPEGGWVGAVRAVMSGLQTRPLPPRSR